MTEKRKTTPFGTKTVANPAGHPVYILYLDSHRPNTGTWCPRLSVDELHLLTSPWKQNRVLLEMSHKLILSHLYELLLLSLSPFVFLTAPDVYAVIRCEDVTVRTRVFKKDGSPEFNTKAIFYRRKPKRNICIEVKCDSSTICTEVSVI